MTCRHQKQPICFSQPHTTFISPLNIMFISAEIASAIIQLQLASPAITHMAAAQPQPKRRKALQGCGGWPPIAGTHMWT
jgi:hypothetical protein